MGAGDVVEGVLVAGVYSARTHWFVVVDWGEMQICSSAIGACSRRRFFSMYICVSGSARYLTVRCKPVDSHEVRVEEGDKYMVAI